jgi:hypothetical protein
VNYVFKRVQNQEHTVTCEVCGVQLFENNMRQHRNTCMNVIAGENQNGRMFYSFKRCNDLPDGITDTKAICNQEQIVTDPVVGDPSKTAILIAKIRAFFHSCGCFCVYCKDQLVAMGTSAKRRLFRSTDDTTNARADSKSDKSVHEEPMRECPHCNKEMRENDVLVHVMSCGTIITGSDRSGQPIGQYIGHVSQCGLGFITLVNEMISNQQQ